MKSLLIALSSSFLLSVPGASALAKDGDPVAPPETVLLEGLKLIRDNKWDEAPGR